MTKIVRKNSGDKLSVYTISLTLYWDKCANSVIFFPDIITIRIEFTHTHTRVSMLEKYEEISVYAENRDDEK